MIDGAFGAVVPNNQVISEYLGNFTNSLAASLIVDTNNGGPTSITQPNWNLTSASPSRGKGVWVSHITSGTGSGTSFNVDKSWAFYQGQTASTRTVPGDTVQIQSSGNKAVITAISGNTLTLNQSVTWTNGSGIQPLQPGVTSLSSANPDVGAFEFTGQVFTNLVMTVSPNPAVVGVDTVNYALAWQTNGVTDIAPQNGNNTLTVFGINIIGVDSGSTLVNGAYNHNQAATIAGSTNVYGVAVYNGLTLTSNIVPLSQTNAVIPPPATNIFYPRFYSPLLFFPDYYIGTNATGLFVTSGAHGSAITPLDGSTISNFDFNMENIPANVTIHILTGTNLTMGGMSWHPKTGQNISGAGTNATFLQFPASLVANGTIADALIIQSVGATHGVTLSNLTLDCNYQVGVLNCRLRGATLLGNSNSMFRVKLINAASYSGTYSECFGLNEFADSAGNGNGCWFNDCTVDNYTCNSNNNLSAINMTGLYNSGYTNCHVWQRDTNSPVYGYSYGGSNIWINSCYGNGLSTFTSDDSLPGRTNCGWINCYATNITQFLNWKSGAESSILISNCVGYLSRQRPGDNGTLIIIGASPGVYPSSLNGFTFINNNFNSSSQVTNGVFDVHNSMNVSIFTNVLYTSVPTTLETNFPSAVNLVITGNTNQVGGLWP